MKLDWLADVLRAEGCLVEEHKGWKTRTGRDFSKFKPVGLLDHHTAGSKVLPKYPDPPFYSNSALEDKCNLTIRPDGVIVCLNAGWAADSGFGDRKVLDAVKADRKAPTPSDTYRRTASGKLVLKGKNPIPDGANAGILGNAHFIDIEVQHLGNGGPIIPPQREALILANAAICRHMGWDPQTRVIGHREWSVRKTDPRWDGKANPMDQIRADTATRLGLAISVVSLPSEGSTTTQGEEKEDDDMPTADEIAQAVWAFPMLSVDGEGVTSQLALSRAHRGVNALLLQPDSAVDPAALAEAIVSGMGEDLAKQVVQELSSRLG